MRVVATALVQASRSLGLQSPQLAASPLLLFLIDKAVDFFGGGGGQLFGLISFLSRAAPQGGQGLARQGEWGLSDEVGAPRAAQVVFDRTFASSLRGSVAGRPSPSLSNKQKRQLLR